MQTFRAEVIGPVGRMETYRVRFQIEDSRGILMGDWHFTDKNVAQLLCDQINKGGDVMQRLANGERLAWLQKPTRLVMPPIEIEQEESEP